MLADFLVAHREVIVARSQSRCAARSETTNALHSANGVPVFIDQLVSALRRKERTDAVDHQTITDSAGRHGGDLLKMGLTIAEVVHVYGDVCQTVTLLAIEETQDLSGTEFQTLNLCLDDAIAQAVTEFSRQRELAIVARGNERLGALAHEILSALTTVMLTFDSMKRGRVPVGGSTGAVLERNLINLVVLAERSLASLRLDAAIQHVERIAIRDFLVDLEVGADLHAQSRGVVFSSSSVDAEIVFDGDRQNLTAALGNLIHNAIKFTRAGGHVELRTRMTGDRIFLEVEDSCGGLPPGKADELFLPFKQAGSDHTGAGLGLAICIKAARASGGDVTIRDIPGKGCEFTLSLPRVTLGTPVSS